MDRVFSLLVVNSGILFQLGRILVEDIRVQYTRPIAKPMMAYHIHIRYRTILQSP